MKTVQDKNLLEMPIGVFDSGMGGLTVMREIMRQIPNEKVIYGESSLWKQVKGDGDTLFQADCPFFAKQTGQGNCCRLQYGERLCVE